MTQRERTLLLLFSGLLVGLLIYLGIGRLQAGLDGRASRIEELQRQVRQMKRTKTRGLLAAKGLKTYRQRSLATDVQLANSNYRAWLHQWLEHAEVTNHDVTFLTRQVVRDKQRGRSHFYDRYAFSVTCHARLDQWIELLYAFYRADHLHRIRQMTVRPVREGMLALTFEVEAVAVAGAGDDKALPSTTSKRLAMGSLEAYMQRILARNPYGPPNQPPHFAGEDVNRVYLGERATVQFSADDPEKKPVRYRLVGQLPGDFKFDEDKGILEWSPEKKGEYEVTVIAEDTGTPPKRTERVVKLVVQDPPPEETPEPGFDLARFTFLTAVIKVNGQPEAWLHNRPEGRMIKVRVGDAVEIGGLKGTIAEIGADMVEIDTGETTIRVGIGQNLRSGELIRDSVAERPR